MEILLYNAPIGQPLGAFLMKSKEVKLAEEMLETIKELLAEKIRILGELSDAVKENTSLKLEVLEAKSSIRIKNKTIDSLKNHINSLGGVEKTHSLNGFTENDIKVLRMLTHPDRTGKDTSQLFIKVNKLLEK